MTPLLGTRNPSTPVGDAPGGDGRAARSLLSCALWRGMGRLWRGMGGHRPPRWQHGLSCSPDVRYFFWSEPGPPTMVFTKHETRDTNHSFPTHDFPPFPTISRHFPAPPPPLRRSSVHAPSAFLGQPPGTAAPARSLLSCALWRGMGRLWRGMGGMARPEPLSAHRQHRQHGLLGFHETRNTAFFRVTAFVVARHGRLWRGMGGILPRVGVLAPSAVLGRPYDERRLPGCSQCRERKMNPC